MAINVSASLQAYLTYLVVVRSFGGLTAGMVEGLKKEAVLATIEESKSLDTTYREFVETSEQIRKLKMVINGCGNYLSDVCFSVLTHTDSEIGRAN